MDAESAAAGALFRRLLDDPALLRAREALSGGASPVGVSGLVESGNALLLTLLQGGHGGPVLVVVPGDHDAALLRKDLQALAALLKGEEAARRIVRFPALDADPYRGLAAHAQVACERVAALHALEANEADLLIAPARALTLPLPLPSEFRRGERRIVPGGRIDLEDLARAVLAMGYRVVDTVTSPGEFCRRGGIVDVWPPHLERPRRVELLGDEVDTIRRYDPTTQRSLNLSGRFDVAPAQEIPLTPERADRLFRAIGSEEGLPESSGSSWPARLAALREEGVLAGAEACASLLEPRTATLVDHAPEAPVVTIEPFRIEEELHQVLAERREAFDETGGGPLPSPESLFLPTDRVLRIVAAAALSLSELHLPDGADGRDVLALTSRPNRSLAGRAADLGREISSLRESGTRVLVFLQAKGALDRLGELLDEQGVPFRRAARGEEDRLEESGATVDLLEGRLGRGVVLTGPRLALFSEREVFGEPMPPPAPRRRRGGPFLSDFRDLGAGDLVVHVDHGVGRYRGLARRREQEMVVLEYRGGERLMVPTDRLDLLQKYNGAGGSRPTLEKLGGGSFQKAKTRARKAVEDISRQLLELYAQRKAGGGLAFGADTPWQREFEEAFPHELTPDQTRTVAEVKSDMESPEAMDRLLCGDVGFGKTEVALRAAFKAVQEGFQVAVLVPTTVLAFQHMNTFRARLTAFPVEVEMVSRFRSRSEIADVLARTASGRVDVLVGTHRLLSTDVRFHRLGLLVIDEEQRFGVRHKERLREISVGVDTVALSATPIPRTLQMSLAGVRDISIIETPPRNRLAIQTHVLPYRAGVVAAAIRNELRRCGQVYVVHHRVASIDSVAAHIGKLVPEARLAVAHGQMGEARLERTMLSFIRGEADVLVSTTIIENGLDIPRVNTLIVTRADQYGLAQLYQLRGRIGRSDLQAYAYFLVPSRRLLRPLARKRLLALQEFSELGSGFRVAARDLEIRGAGEMLGSRQHGHIAAVGFDLYARMLERAVRELRAGEPLPEEQGISINLGVEHRLPESYVPEPGLRLQLYHRLAAAESSHELETLGAELKDRFGELPPPARALFRLAELRLMAGSLGATGLDWVDGAVAVRFGPTPKIDADDIVSMVASDPDVSITPAGVLRVRASEEGMDRIAAASLVLRRLAC